MGEVRVQLKRRTMVVLTLVTAVAMPLAASDLVITGVVDGPLTVRLIFEALFGSGDGDRLRINHSKALVLIGRSDD